MKVLIAEDDPDTLLSYQITLEDRGHKVTTTTNGIRCTEAYRKAMDETTQSRKGAIPFDVVILDYRMPKKDGMEVAKEILELNPEQRLIFASAYVKETLVDAIKELKQVVELMQKPFTADVLADMIEDKEIYSGLKALMVNVREIKDSNPTHQQIKDLFEGLRKIQKGRTF